MNVENSARDLFVFPLTFIPALFSMLAFKSATLQPQRVFLRRRKIYSSLSSEFIKPKRIRMH